MAKQPKKNVDFSRVTSEESPVGSLTRLGSSNVVLGTPVMTEENYGMQSLRRLTGTFEKKKEA